MRMSWQTVFGERLLLHIWKMQLYRARLSPSDFVDYVSQMVSVPMGPSREYSYEEASPLIDGVVAIYEPPSSNNAAFLEYPN